MTSKKLNKRIAVILGWHEIPNPDNKKLPKSKKVPTIWVNGGRVVEGEEGLPNYHDDLNAIHEAEKWLVENHNLAVFWHYAENLYKIVPAIFGKDSYLLATAEQKAKAFLMTVEQLQANNTPVS